MLTVAASDRDNDELTYQYSVSNGDIEGAGSMVTWNLNKVGTQKATVEVSDSKGAKSSRTVEIKVIPCGTCDPPRTWLRVGCPKDVSEGETAVFEATIDGDYYDDYDRKRRIFLWRHSGGKRIQQPAGPILRIQASGLPGDVIAATVRVLGLDPTESSEASCRTEIVKRVQ